MKTSASILTADPRADTGSTEPLIAMESLFHIALATDWREAQREGVYRISTLGKRLEDQGYIHLSFAHQVKRVADRIYRGTRGLLLLQIDPAKVTAPIVVEPGEGTTEQFPHLYGELEVAAVIDVREYRPDDERATGERS